MSRGNLFTAVFCLCSVFSSIATADQINELPQPTCSASLENGFVKLMTPNGVYDLGPVYVLKAGTTLYHWGSEVEIEDLLRHPKFDVNGMNYRMLHAQHGGGGFFASLDRTDSKSYGPAGAYFILGQDILVLHMEDSEFLGSDFMMGDFMVQSDNAQVEMALRAIGVVGIKENVNQTWYNIFDPRVLNNPHRI